MSEIEELTPWAQTERFDIWQSVMVRSRQLGGLDRTVFHAWYHSEDIAKPVCVVTVWESMGNFVEWIHVDENHRRQGIASEILTEIESKIGVCELSAASDTGESFVSAYEGQS